MASEHGEILLVLVTQNTILVAPWQVDNKVRAGGGETNEESPGDHDKGLK